MKESEFQSHFARWAFAHLPTCALEYKVRRGGTFNLKEWEHNEPQQIRSLVKAKKEVLYHKLPDIGRIPKPLDGFLLRNEEAYLVIFWEKFGKVTVIPIEALLPFLGQSIKHDVLTDICHYVINIQEL